MIGRGLDSVGEAPSPETLVIWRAIGSGLADMDAAAAFFAAIGRAPGLAAELVV